MKCHHDQIQITFTFFSLNYDTVKFYLNCVIHSNISKSSLKGVFLREHDTEDGLSDKVEIRESSKVNFSRIKSYRTKSGFHLRYFT